MSEPMPEPKPKPTSKRRARQIAQACATRKWNRQAKTILGGIDLEAFIEQYGNVQSLLRQTYY